MVEIMGATATQGAFPFFYCFYSSSLIGLAEPPIRILAQMAKNLQTTGLNNISFQHQRRLIQTQRASAFSLLDTKQNWHSSYFSGLQK